MLASRGIDSVRIQAMGLWRSPMVLHYATAALGTGLAALVERHMPLAAPRTDVAAETAALRRQTASLERRLSLLEALEPAPPPAFRPTPTRDIIENAESRKVHRRSTRKPSATYCGWAFAGKEHRLHDDVPAGTKWLDICAYCLPTEQELVRLGCVQNGASDSE